MSYTRDFYVGSESWSDMGRPSLVQLKTPGPVLIQIGSGAPENGNNEGVLLFSGGVQEIALGAFEDTDSVYAKCLQDEGNTLATIGQGAAP